MLSCSQHDVPDFGLPCWHFLNKIGKKVEEKQKDLKQKVTNKILAFLHFLSCWENIKIIAQTTDFHIG